MIAPMEAQPRLTSVEASMPWESMKARSLAVSPSIVIGEYLHGYKAVPECPIIRYDGGTRFRRRAHVGCEVILRRSDAAVVRTASAFCCERPLPRGGVRPRTRRSHRIRRTQDVRRARPAATAALSTTAPSQSETGERTASVTANTTSCPVHRTAAIPWRPSVLVCAQFRASLATSTEPIGEGMAPKPVMSCQPQAASTAPPRGQLPRAGTPLC